MDQGIVESSPESQKKIVNDALNQALEDLLKMQNQTKLILVVCVMVLRISDQKPISSI